MTKRSKTRRRFLAASGATALSAMAGCMDRVTSALPSNGTDGNNSSSGNGSGGGGNSNAKRYKSPELSVETEFNSREEFKQPGKQLDNFENLKPWSVSQGSAKADKNVSFEGSQSLQLTGKKKKDVVVERKIDQKDLTDFDISMAVRTSTPDNIAIDIKLVDIYGGFAHHELRNVTYKSSEVGWFRTNPGVFKESSTKFERDLVNEIQIVVYNTGNAKVWVDDLRLHKKPEKGYVVLSWDDGHTDFYDKAAPLHDKHGVNAVQAAVRQWTRGNRKNTMTVDQLKERQKAGDQIVAHGSHTQFAKLNKGDLKESLRRDKHWAVDQGLQGGHYIVYPHNSVDKTVLDVASKYYYAGGFNQSGGVNLTGVHGFDPLLLPRTIGHSYKISKRCVDLAAKHRNCAILNFHAFNQKNTMDKKKYKKLLKHISQKDNLEVIDLDDLWKMRRQGHNL